MRRISGVDHRNLRNRSSKYPIRLPVADVLEALPPPRDPSQSQYPKISRIFLALMFAMAEVKCRLNGMELSCGGGGGGGGGRLWSSFC